MFNIPKIRLSFIKDWIVVDAFAISSNGTKLINNLDDVLLAITPLVSKPGVSVYMVAGMRVIAPSL